MVKFLIQRPIATCMTFIALFVLGLASYQKLPISLLPDISIPEVTVRVKYDQFSAREMEKNIVHGLRSYFKQCSGFRDIYSESSDGLASIKIRFEHGTDIDLASIEVNEKIDRVLTWLPKDLARPVVIKASAADIPVFFLNMSFKNEFAQEDDFLDLSRFTNEVIKKRLERLAEVGIVDISGTQSPEISIIPDQQKMESLGISYKYLEDVIKSNNLSFGNISLKDGYYRYDIRFSSQMSSIEDIKHLMLVTQGRILSIGDIAKVQVRPTKSFGLFLDGNRKAISMAVIKQADAKMQDLEESLRKETDRIIKDYPNIRFDIAQDQTSLLDYSIANLKSTLGYGAILALLVLFLFLSNLRLPLLMGITIPVSIVISTLFFMLVDISINIISLSGLALGIGLMIDNSIVVIENITQYRERGQSLARACVLATNEVIRPLLSSALTTSAVFVPLVFVSGMTGALFYDQAITITVSLLISFMVSITLLPVLYMAIHRKTSQVTPSKRSFIDLGKLYERGLGVVFKKPTLSTLLFLALIPFVYFLYLRIEKEIFPIYEQNDMLVTVKWNENINLDEAHKRIDDLFSYVEEDIDQFNAWIGSQDYILNRDYDLKKDEVRLYIKVSQKTRITELEDVIRKRLDHSAAEIGFSVPDNLFVKTFKTEQVPLIINLLPKNTGIAVENVKKTISEVDKIVGYSHHENLNYVPSKTLEYDKEKLLLYNVNEDELIRALKTEFNEYHIGKLNTSGEVLPMVLGGIHPNLESIINGSFVKNREGTSIAIKEFVKIGEQQDFEIIHGGKNGMFFPLSYEVHRGQLSSIESQVKEAVSSLDGRPFEIEWSGALYEFGENMSELVYILLLSLLLLYFILAIQFESLWQPLIILLEIPIDLSGAFLLLLLLDSSLNVMSAIGIVVMTGIIINDSILKLDTINTLYRKEKLPLMDAIHQGGLRRIRPIVMTSATTVLALMPFLFGQGLGTELQKPLALAVIGGLGLGTVVSLYFVPLCYWWIYRNKKIDY